MEIVKFQSQEHVSDLERRKLPRMSLSSEIFRLHSNGKLYPAVDISEGGMAIRVIDREDLGLMPVGHRFKGTLSLSGTRLQVEAQVRHIGGELIGCKFIELGEQESGALKQFLDPALIARSLKPIPALERGTIWYHGTSGTDLVFWRSLDNQFTRFALCILGTFIQWEQGLGVSTGTPRFSSHSSGDSSVARFETMMLQADAAPDAEKLAVAKTLFVSSNLPEDLKRFCLKKLGA